MDKDIKKATLKDILGSVVIDKKIEKLTAEEYVVMQLQMAENTINRNTALLATEQRNNSILKMRNDKLASAISFIFKNFEFEFVNKKLYVTYGYAEVEDESLKQIIENLIKEFNQTEEEKK